MKWNSSLSIETGVPVRAASRLTAQLRSEKWFNIGVNSAIRARYTTDVTVVLKYEIPAIRNSVFLTGNHTCILKYLYFLSLKAI